MQLLVDLHASHISKMEADNKEVRQQLRNKVKSLFSRRDATYMTGGLLP